MGYTFKITKTLHYYGYPQAHYKYDVKSSYLNGTLDYYGNQGWDAPRFERRENNGYFWSLRCFMKDLYGERSQIEQLCRSLSEGESKEITLGE